VGERLCRWSLAARYGLREEAEPIARELFAGYGIHLHLFDLTSLDPRRRAPARR
jgi:hypothetical protein